MDRNTSSNSHNVLISKYEKLLSPFGRKVMTSLLTIKIDSDMKTIKPINEPSRSINKKVIIFKDTDDHITNTNTLSMNENVRDSQIDHFEDKKNDSSSVSTSVDLLNTLPNINLDDTSNGKETRTETRSDDHFQNSPHLTNSILSTKIPTTKDVIQETRKGISWNDFFKAEIFEDQDDSEENYIESTKQFEANTSANNMNQIITVNVLSVGDNDQETINNCDKSEDDNRKRNNPSKHGASKKLKKPESNKNIFRKEKYTKTVKNWLNKVDPANVVEEDVLEEHGTDTIPKLDFYNRKMNESSSNIKKAKRTIQAQLANKNGVMKFTKP